jgi:alpha-ribazole phosphatase
MQLLFLRHSLTAGNLEHRYIGCRTDEPLCPTGVTLAQQQAAAIQAFAPEQVMVSPMRRCRQTASLLFPSLEQTVFPALAECDFGDFEGKNYQELSGNPAYQRWIDSGGTLPFPNGESPAQFITRCCQAVTQLVQNQTAERIAVVAHGGTMMAVFSACEAHRRSYFDWQIPHCVPFLCTVLSKEPLQLQWEEEP